MESTSSVTVSAFIVLVVMMLLGGGFSGLAAGVSSGGPALADSAARSIDDTLNTTDGTSESIQNTTNETTDGLENTTDELSGSNDSVETAVNETTAVVDDTVSTTTETVDATVAAVNGTVNGTAINASVGAEAGIGGRTTSGDDGSSDAETASPSNRGDGSSGDETGSSETPSPAETAADAALVGLLGAITASGAAAGTASGSGAAGSASTATAGWLRQIRTVGDLQRAGSSLPWKILPLFRYSKYDDSDPLEHDRRRAVYEVIEREPGCYLSRVSDRTDIPLSTVRHHVRILEDEDLVTGLKVNGKRRYFLDAADAELRAALAESAKREVLETLADLGRAHNGRLADELERDPSTVSHHLSALAEDELVVREKDGRSVVNELPPRVEAALVDDPVSDAGSHPAPADD
ncbi:helix-turn-helix domain-containing protein [Natrinema sp. 1APR25-10V2]|uniref:helix-turn-helix domain-containing protein n=1 Tax=Natrinema sp. 1APR25-10V2 TaxID=2951081 RepID=UPI0028751F9F|nr:helix-turn-helix domain-containing protein [Natrinema sp. 1APR25-10V2]MDS0474891.1 ArsR family transcriptional regulator [Natrinema sp. 1APR25-10V2]